jgi:hypothetical protein
VYKTNREKSKREKMNVSKGVFNNETLLMKKEEPVDNFLLNLFAGGISGIGAKTASAPIERVKLLMQTQAVNRHIIAKTYTNPFSCMLQIYRYF